MGRCASPPSRPRHQPGQPGETVLPARAREMGIPCLMVAPRTWGDAAPGQGRRPSRGHGHPLPSFPDAPCGERSVGPRHRKRCGSPTQTDVSRVAVEFVPCEPPEIRSIGARAVAVRIVTPPFRVITARRIRTSMRGKMAVRLHQLVLRVSLFASHCRPGHQWVASRVRTRRARTAAGFRENSPSSTVRVGPPAFNG